MAEVFEVEDSDFGGGSGHHGSGFFPMRWAATRRKQDSRTVLRLPGLILVCFGWFGCVVSCSQMRGVWSAHHTGSLPMQPKVIWDLYLHTDPEGPSPISNTALRFGYISSRIRDTLAA